MEGESAFGYLNRALELDLSECSRQLEKRCEDASHSKALRAKSMTWLFLFCESFWSAHCLSARVRASSRRFASTAGTPEYF
jgi:hypothetical protein